MNETIYFNQTFTASQNLINSVVKIKCGDKIFFSIEKKPYTVKACNDRYLICTKPYNFKKTVLYTIIDLKKNIRGPNNLVFNMYDYAVQRDIIKCLLDLKKGDIEISHRKRVALDIIKIIVN